MGRQSKFSPEVQERAVRLVFEQTEEHGSQWAAICSIAVKIGCIPETLRRWVRDSERKLETNDGQTVSDKERIRQLERENRELKKSNEILRLASAYFAKAELDRRQR
jgi:transposase